MLGALMHGQNVLDEKGRWVHLQANEKKWIDLECVCLWMTNWFVKCETSLVCGRFVLVFPATGLLSLTFVYGISQKKALTAGYWNVRYTPSLLYSTMHKEYRKILGKLWNNLYVIEYSILSARTVLDINRRSTKNQNNEESRLFHRLNAQMNRNAEKGTNNGHVQVDSRISMRNKVTERRGHAANVGPLTSDALFFGMAWNYLLGMGTFRWTLYWTQSFSLQRGNTLTSRSASIRNYSQSSTLKKISTGTVRVTENVLRGRSWAKRYIPNITILSNFSPSIKDLWYSSWYETLSDTRKDHGRAAEGWWRDGNTT